MENRWITILPGNTGGGRKAGPPTATLSEKGQLHISKSTAEMLGTPRKVKIEVNPHLASIRLRPATPDDAGAFFLSGGGNSPYKSHTRAIVRDYPHLTGRYTARKINGGVELEKIS